MSIKIRKATLKDFDYLFKTLNTVHELQNSGDSDSYSNELVKSFLTSNKKLAIIADDNGTPVGFLTCLIHLDASYSYIWDIYVDPKYRMKGVGGDLLKYHEELCRKKGISEITLSVHLNNAKMQNYIEKKGFLKGHATYYYIKNIK